MVPIGKGNLKAKPVFALPPGKSLQTQMNSIRISWNQTTKKEIVITKTALIHSSQQWEWGLCLEVDLKVYCRTPKIWSLEQYSMFTSQHYWRNIKKYILWSWEQSNDSGSSALLGWTDAKECGIWEMWAVRQADLLNIYWTHCVNRFALRLKKSTQRWFILSKLCYTTSSNLCFKKQIEMELHWIININM